jgi:NAD(P)H-nitrite reductase large subunit
MVKIQKPNAIAKKAISFRIQEEAITQALDQAIIPENLEDDAMVCLCERVTVAEVKKWIHKGINDINQIKAITRMGMGPCGSKTCDVTLKQIFRQEGIPIENVIPNTRRPVFIEVPLEKFADGKE